MLLQIASFEEDGDALEEGVRHVREEVVPSIEGAEGLIAAYWAVDRENGGRVSVMVWEGPEAAAAAMPAVVASIKSRREAAGRTTPQASPASTARYEVVEHV
jgi:hypothetical protein